MGALIVVVMACSSPKITPETQPTKPATGGSRLKERYYAAADGAEQTIGLFDSQRGENCGFVNAADNVVRCLPATATAQPAGFLDSACTQAVASYPSACAPTPPKYTVVSVAFSNTCYPAATHMFNVGVVVKPAPMMIYTNVGKMCTAQPADMTRDYYQTGQEIPATSFVAATEKQR
jgi:hypothetical protein